MHGSLVNAAPQSIRYASLSSLSAPLARSSNTERQAKPAWRSIRPTGPLIPVCAGRMSGSMSDRLPLGPADRQGLGDVAAVGTDHVAVVVHLVHEVDLRDADLDDQVDHVALVELALDVDLAALHLEARRVGLFTSGQQRQLRPAALDAFFILVERALLAAVHLVLDGLRGVVFDVPFGVGVLARRGLLVDCFHHDLPWCGSISTPAGSRWSRDPGERGSRRRWHTRRTGLHANTRP